MTDFKYLKLKFSEKERIEIIKNLLEIYKKRLSKSTSNEKYIRPPFSVIVVTHNSFSTIEPLFASLKASITDRDEIIIVDNASKDETLSLVEKFTEENNIKNIKILSLKENIGYAAAINKGVKISKHNYLAFVNPDTVLPNNWITIVYEHLKEKQVGAVGAISNYVIDFQNILRFSNLAKILKDEDFCRYVNLINEHLRNLYKGQFEEKNFLVGFFLATKKEVFKEVGKFDKELFLGMDDLDYSLKLREHGYKLILPKDLFIYHQGHVSFKKNKEAEKLKELTENTFAEKLVKKYGFGKVPLPEKLWADKDAIYFAAFVPTNPKYRFMFKFLDKDIDFRHVAQEILRKPKIGIVTVTYFSSNDIYIMAKSLFNSTYQNFHWYIIDHSEDKEEFERLKKSVSILSKEKITVINRKNSGYAAGINFGTNLALKDSCEYIWILNPDVEVESNTLLELLKTSLFTGVPVVTCKMKDSLERDKLQYDGFKANYRPFSDYPQRIRKVFFLSGANIFLKSDVVKKIKFNENYFLYFEDNDFHEKLQKIGIEPIYTPYATIYHKNKNETFPNSPIEVYYFYRNLIYFFKRKADYPFIIKNLKFAYEHFFSKKKNLRALISAIYDGTFNILGKKDLSSKFRALKDDNKILKEYLQLRRISKVLALEKGRNYLLLKPRHSEIFFKYLKDAVSIMFYSEERNGRKS
ncbi:glycosyl transferase family 2 [Desulfurobacterium thermolithotrophum DSM 11699]|uniref:Glycosyl transferase family 2 n=1 Tax=Desulfurobacterium thermolithotrophum (strain DSM 11699 / BSA) TaxID=868864 RepID=F0S147_DESTD|nr:glycosyltransferase [Desulfurobacterium thermolithotrophum]ADY73925.1 glycosyl transferase family 2 [Desulfurobacterium thermolithotrophum DSM 11699]